MNKYRMHINEVITETRDSLFNWIKQQFPTWPDYVLKDFLYQQAKGIRDQAELEDFLKRNKQDFGQVQWRLEKLPITMDIFTPKTQRMIQSREGGSSNPFEVPRDAERHAQQLKMIQQQGVSAEPIIVAKLSNGYDLIEGWHRTIQHLQVYPQGYTAPAWVGYGATYQSINENFADGKHPGRKGLAKRVGVNCKQSVTKLRSIAAHSSGERQRMAHWCANMKSGKRKKLNEFSPNTLNGSFTKDLVFNKLWLIRELERIKTNFDTVYILGSWYGNMSLLLTKSRIEFSKIINVDTDPEAIDVSRQITKLSNIANVTHMIKDANALTYEQLAADGLVINTSCHDMEDRGWFDHIPAGTMVALQSRTDVEDDLSSYQFAEVLYEGSLELEDPETKYTSLLKIGIK